MAADKIVVIHNRLDRCIQYACNPAKTTLPERQLVDGINCLPQTAFSEMRATKNRWGKTDGVQGYHIIHSYAPGEVTPEQAHALGVEFARRLLGEKYEAIVATHLDHAHLHCHIVFNSVSFVDGKKYQNKFHDYFGDIRETSNAVSRENDLSVITPKEKGKHYVEWNAEQKGNPTIRGLIRRDMDAALAESFSLTSFFTLLKKQGYAIKRGPSITHTAVRPPGGSRFIRLDSLGEGYTEADLMHRLHSGEIHNPTPTVPLAPSSVKKHYTIIPSEKVDWIVPASSTASGLCMSGTCISSASTSSQSTASLSPSTSGQKSLSWSNTKGNSFSCKSTGSKPMTSSTCSPAHSKQI